MAAAKKRDSAFLRQLCYSTLTQGARVEAFIPGWLHEARQISRNYFARRHVDSAFVPVEVAGFAVFISSALSEVMVQFRSVALKPEKVLPSNRTVIVLSVSLTEYVPYMAIAPLTMALFCSGVPACARLAIFGRSDRISIWVKWPDASNI